MCGGGPPPPDPRIGQATLDQIDFSKKQYDDFMAPGGDHDYIRGVTDRTLGLQDQALGIQRDSVGLQQHAQQKADEMQDYELGQARTNDARYQNVYVPYEDQLLKQVNDQDTDSFRQSQVNRSLADTQMQFDSSRQQGIRSMTRRGANPNSGAYGAMMADGGRAQAMAMATAANKTRLASQQVGLSNKMQMYGGMKGMAGLGATSAQLALGAGGQSASAAQGIGATGAGMANTGMGMGNTGLMPVNANNAALGIRSQGIGSGISGYNSYYGNQVSGAKVAADSNPMNSMLGAAAGALSTYGMALALA